MESTHRVEIGGERIAVTLLKPLDKGFHVGRDYFFRGLGLWALDVVPKLHFSAPECPGGVSIVSHPPVRQRRALPAGRKERRGGVVGPSGRLDK